LILRAQVGRVTLTETESKDINNGKTLRIICQNNSNDNKYIQSIRLNGKPLNQVWFRHADIVNGGTLELQMGNTPNKKLGSDPASFPPSEMALKLSDFVTPH
jgi:putative alpha-1,2-mannosidase